MNSLIEHMPKITLEGLGLFENPLRPAKQGPNPISELQNNTVINVAWTFHLIQVYMLLLFDCPI